MMKSGNKDEPELFRYLYSVSEPCLMLNKEEKVTAIIKVRRDVRDLMKHECRKDQRYSDYILELIQYKKEHEGHIKKEGVYGANPRKAAPYSQQRTPSEEIIHE